MQDNKKPPIMFFSPFVSSTMEVKRYEGTSHQVLGFSDYADFFDRGAKEAFAIIGLASSSDRLSKDRAVLVQAENHFTLSRDLAMNEPARVTVQLIAFDEARVHYYMELRHAKDGWLIAACEHLCIHLHVRSRRPVPFTSIQTTNLDIMKTAHARMPSPLYGSRCMELPEDFRTYADRALVAGSVH